MVKKKLTESDDEGYNKDMGAWQKSIETRLMQLHGAMVRLDDKIDRHFLWLITAAAAGISSILFVIAKGFHWL